MQITGSGSDKGGGSDFRWYNTETGALLARLGYADGVFDVLGGFRVNGGASAGYVLRANGSVYAPEKLNVEGGDSVTVGSGALATSATDGFIYIPECAGTPTGVPTARAGFVPLVYDSVGGFLYVGSGGTWQRV